MNQRVKTAAAALFFALFAYPACFGEELSVPDLMAGAESQLREVRELSAKVSKVREDMEAAITSFESARSEIRQLKTELKSLEEKQGEIRLLAVEIGSIKSKLSAMEKRYDEDINQMRKNLDEFNDMKNILKQSATTMKSWDDIIGVLKKQISNTEMEMAGMKKEIKELRRQYAGGDDLIGSIVNWPYMGITALLISIAAFIAAVAR